MGHEGYLQVEDGLRLYYDTLGEGREAIVIPLACWLKGDLEQLAHGRRLIFYDPRNRGRSDGVADKTRLGIDYEVRDLEAIREHFGLEQVSLVGWSYLGGVVARYAMDDPARVKRLVLVCPDSPRRHPYREESELLARKAASRIDRTSLARLNEMRQAGLEAKDPATYCREAWKVFLMGRVGNPAVVSRLRFDFCASPNETPSNFLE